jgi:hypothetical protein
MLSLGTGMNIQITKMLEEWADLTVIRISAHWWDNHDLEVPPPDLDDDMVNILRELDNVVAVLPIVENIWMNNPGGALALYTADAWAISGSLVAVDMSAMEAFGYTTREGRLLQEGDPPSSILMGPYAGADIWNFWDDEYKWADWCWETWVRINMPIEDIMAEELRIVPLVYYEQTFEWGTWYEADYSDIGNSRADSADYDFPVKLLGIIEPPPGDWAAQEGIFIDIKFFTEMKNAFEKLNPDYEHWMFQNFDGTYNNVRVRVDDMKNVEAVEEEIKAMGFRTFSFVEAREQMQGQVRTIQMLLAMVAAVSLFVAMMNITNTMIMAIIERTKEIGIMKVLGCDVGKIRTMFLGEAALIGFLGGVAGTAFSYLLSFIINNFLGEFFMDLFGYGTPEEEAIAISVIPLPLVFAAIAGATVIGMLAGLYPAHRSLKISALSAIAHE